jgi:hypothetical protein
MLKLIAGSSILRHDTQLQRAVATAAGCATAAQNTILTHYAATVHTNRCIRVCAHAAQGVLQCVMHSQQFDSAVYLNVPLRVTSFVSQRQVM